MTSIQHRIDFFEKFASHYDLFLDLLTLGQYSGFQRKALKVLAPHVGEKMLDLCSGTGRVASWMATAVGDKGEVVGIDLSKRMVELARRRCRKFKNVSFLLQDVTQRWPFQNYFDGIFTSFALHELPEKNRLEVLGHCYQALKERGRMVIADFNPNISGYGETILLVFFKLFERENLNFFSFGQEAVLKRAGFKRSETLLVLRNMFQITVAYRCED